MLYFQMEEQNLSTYVFNENEISFKLIQFRCFKVRDETLTISNRQLFNYKINSRDVRDGYEIMQKQNQQLNNFFQICFHFDVVYWRLISDENTKILDKTFSHLTHLLQSKWRDSFQVETWPLWKRTPRSKPDPDMSIQNSIVFLYLHLLPLYCLNFPDSK